MEFGWDGIAFEGEALTKNKLNIVILTKEESLFKKRIFPWSE
jgi:hypothetical protein